MRLAISLLAVTALVLAAGCAKQDDHSVGADLRNVGHDVGHAATEVARNDDVRHAEADLRAAAHDAGHDLHKAETEARDAFRALSADLRHSAHHATSHDAPDRTNG
jgi:hypothetical protein